jgi:hypothetical protein
MNAPVVRSVSAVLLRRVEFGLFTGDPCTTRDGSEGLCTNIEKCQAAKDEIKTGKLPSICGFDARVPIVCCATPRSPTLGQPRPTSPAPVLPTEQSKSKQSE